MEACFKNRLWWLGTTGENFGKFDQFQNFAIRWIVIYVFTYIVGVGNQKIMCQKLDWSLLAEKILK